MSHDSKLKRCEKNARGRSPSHSCPQGIPFLPPGAASVTQFSSILPEASRHLQANIYHDLLFLFTQVVHTVCTYVVHYAFILF